MAILGRKPKILWHEPRHEWGRNLSKGMVIKTPSDHIFVVTSVEYTKATIFHQEYFHVGTRQLDRWGGYLGRLGEYNPGVQRGSWVEVIGVLDR